jgi:hypothetical protein
VTKELKIVKGKILLNWISLNYKPWAQTGFVWLRIGTSYSAGENGNETASFIQGGGFTNQIYSDDTRILGWYTVLTVGRDSVGGIATGYGLDSTGIKSRCRRDFPHPSRPALKPTQPPIKQPVLSRG